MNIKKANEVIVLLRDVKALFVSPFHNAISKTLIWFGLALIAEKQVNIVEVVLVAILEKMFGQLDFLRNQFSSEVPYWFSFALIISALIYNAVVTYRLNPKMQLVQKENAEFSTCLKGIDGEKYKDEIIFEGAICNVPERSLIPDFYLYDANPMGAVYSEAPSFGKVPKIVGEIRVASPLSNNDYYREMRDILFEYGGSNIFTLAVSNSSQVPSTSTKVEVHIIEPQKLFHKRGNKNVFPDFPVEDTFDSLRNFKAQDYDIDRSTSFEGYKWNVGPLSPGETVDAKTKILFRPVEKTNIQIKIYSNELTEPFEQKIELHPTDKKISISIEDLKNKKTCSEKLYEGIKEEIINH